MMVPINSTCLNYPREAKIPCIADHSTIAKLKRDEDSHYSIIEWAIVTALLKSVREQAGIAIPQRGETIPLRGPSSRPEAPKRKELPLQRGKSHQKAALKPLGIPHHTKNPKHQEATKNKEAPPNKKTSNSVGSLKPRDASHHRSNSMTVRHLDPERHLHLNPGNYPNPNPKPHLTKYHPPSRPPHPNPNQKPHLNPTTLQPPNPHPHLTKGLEPTATQRPFVAHPYNALNHVLPARQRKAKNTLLTNKTRFAHCLARKTKLSAAVVPQAICLGFVVLYLTYKHITRKRAKELWGITDRLWGYSMDGIMFNPHHPQSQP